MPSNVDPELAALIAEDPLDMYRNKPVAAPAPQPGTPAPKKTESTKIAPSFQDNLTAAARSFTAGAVNNALRLFPELSSMVLPAATTALTKGGMKAVPLVGAADTAMTLAGIGAPLMKNVSPAVSEAMTWAGKHAPSEMAAQAVQDYLGGDVSKASGAAGMTGALAGLNPTQLIKSGVTEGAKGVVKTGAKQAAELAGMETGADWTGHTLAKVASDMMGADLDEEQRNALSTLVFAPLGGKSFSAVAGKVLEKGSAAKAARDVLANDTTNKRIQEIETAAPIERTVDEQQVAKQLIKQGMSPDDALKAAKASSYGAYGGLGQSKTLPFDQSIVDATLNVVNGATKDTNLPADAKAPIDIVNTAVKAVKGLKDIVDNPEMANLDLNAPLKADEALGAKKDLLQEIGGVVPKVADVVKTPEFKQWSNEHNMSEFPEADQQRAVGRYLLNQAIDAHREKVIEPLREDLMNTKTNIADPDKFTDHVLNAVLPLANPMVAPTLRATLVNKLDSSFREGRLRTMDGVVNLMNSLDNDGVINRGREGDMKTGIMSYFAPEVQDKYATFKNEYGKFMEDYGSKSPLGKMSRYDGSNSDGSTAAFDALNHRTSEQDFGSLIKLAKDQPDSTYATLNGFRLALAEAQKGKSDVDASKAVTSLIRDHISRLDAVANALPEGHPVRDALSRTQGLLDVANAHAQLAEEAAHTEKALNRLVVSQDAIDAHAQSLAHYGDYAVKSFDSLVDTMKRDPGMFRAINASPLASDYPLAHDIAKSLIETDGVNPDVSQNAKMFQALAMAQGPTNAVQDLVRYGIGQQVVKHNSDGTVDGRATLAEFKAKAPKIRTYVANARNLVANTPGLSPEQVAQSTRYLDHVSDTVDAATSDLILKVFDRQYGNVEANKSKGVLEDAGLPVNTALNRSTWNKGVNWKGMGILAAKGMWDKIVHGKDSIDAAIISKLDNPDFVKSVSALNDGYEKLRAEDVAQRAKNLRATRTMEVPPSLKDQFKNVFNALMPESSGIQLGFMDKMANFLGKLNKLHGNTRSFISAKQTGGSPVAPSGAPMPQAPQQTDEEKQLEAEINAYRGGR